jgi:hypothetical protein
VLAEATTAEQSKSPAQSPYCLVLRVILWYFFMFSLFAKVDICVA